ncbi:alpha/beta fold hydrolase [Mycobacterium sp. GA-2829]|uniref:alpha/beta fold hydrolase n=1 Tax=Mycobacterium sp. GA-2829 TaxID=1772283 RepID=UPI0007404303|nr:alpha/beta fold hydrolase [Mycobacterium sp. GA-2829]KUI32676.1 alpha/beta hydrolase [Mycobacterium sp. GA-2829]
MKQYRRGGLVFDVIDEGPADGPVVVLLHGFPQMNTSWNGVIDRLTAGGYRCLAPNQRGYSPGARPTRRRDYGVSELVEDVRALFDVCGAARVHLVGHDWGAMVAWAVAAAMPERLTSLTALSVPHPAAFLRAMPTSRQAFASWYVYFFQLPGVPEKYFLGSDGDPSRLSAFMQSKGGQPKDAADRDARAMSEPGVLTAALNWYRAMPLSGLPGIGTKTAVPTMYVWSDGDAALMEKGARLTERYVGAEYRFEILSGSHWMLDEQPDTVADLLLDWLANHPT